jgi:cob(I)alamin adenosyltransferase
MTIATKKGDKGRTALIGGTRVSKADLRVEAYGTIDELGASMGFARSICGDDEIVEITRTIQRDLFAVCAVVATEPEKAKGGASPVTAEMLAALDAHVQRIEATDGIFGDWALPGDHAAAAAYDVARTVCRRAERHVVRLAEGDELTDETVLAYLNRLSDLLWLFGRLLEVRAGVDSKLRGAENGPTWSKAW